MAALPLWPINTSAQVERVSEIDPSRRVDLHQDKEPQGSNRSGPKFKRGADLNDVDLKRSI